MITCSYSMTNFLHLPEDYKLKHKFAIIFQVNTKKINASPHIAFLAIFVFQAVRVLLTGSIPGPDGSGPLISSFVRTSG